MNDQPQEKFEGWAVLELLGRNREIGFVTTAYFGGPALFRVDQPPLPEREHILERPQWIGERHCPIGTHILREALPGKTVFVNPSSLYKMTPCTEETAKQAIERMLPVPIKIVSIPEQAQIAAGEGAQDLDDDDHAEDEPRW